MVEIELFLDNQAWHQSWLLSTVDISSNTEKFSGVVISEILEKIDGETVRCLLTVAAHLPEIPQEIPSVISSNTELYPNLKRLSPSAGTSWPIPNSSEILISFVENNLNNPIAIGSLYNNLKTDVVNNQNSTQHILRANSDSELVIDDDKPNLNFMHKQHNIHLSDSVAITTPKKILIQASKNIISQSQHDAIETAENNYTRNVGRNFNLNTQTGNIEYNSGKDLNITSSKNIILSSPKNISINSSELLAIHSTSKQSILGQNNIAIKSSGMIKLDTNQDLYIIAEKKIMLNLNGSSIEITDGTINFNAPQITVSGQVMLSVKPTSPM
jgi:uncharacterized protein (DUF2345 family)